MRDHQEKRTIVLVTALNAIGLVTQLFIHYHLVDWIHDKAEKSVAAKISAYETIPLVCFALSLMSIWWSLTSRDRGAEVLPQVVCLRVLGLEAAGGRVSGAQDRLEEVMRKMLPLSPRFTIHRGSEVQTLDAGDELRRTVAIHSPRASSSIFARPACLSPGATR